MKKVGIIVASLVVGGIGYLVVWQLVNDVFTGIVIGGIVAIFCHGLLKNRFSLTSAMAKEVQKRLSSEKMAAFYTDITSERKRFARPTAENQKSCSVLAITNRRIYQLDQLKNTEIDIPLVDIQTISISENKFTVHTQQETHNIPLKPEWEETIISALMGQKEFPRAAMAQKAASEPKI